jgi:spermidine synthase
MNKILGIGFLLMGFSFTVTQAVLIRELLVSFFGNELSIGLILGCWLILEAIGSGVLGRLAGRWGQTAGSFAVLQILFALLLPLCLYAAFASRSLVGGIPGEGVGLVPIFWASLLILAPVGLVDGAMFAFGAQVYAHLTGAQAPSIGRVYVFEAVGGLVGGLVFTFLFIPFLLSLQIVVLLSALNLFVAGLILNRSGLSSGLRWSLSAILVVLALGALGFLASPRAEAMQRRIIGQQWPGYNLRYSENSVYGNVAVVERAGQFTFFANGVPILTAPVPDVAQVEELAHLPMLFVAEPERVLVLGGGMGGVLHELAKYPLQDIDYAELDPLLIEAVRSFPTPLTLSELSDPRLQIEQVDGRLLVRQKHAEASAGARERYDLILVNLPYPSTLQLNRFYTVEFFTLVRPLLAADGVVVIGSPGTLSYMSAEIRNLNATVLHTLQQVFPAIRPIPGDLTLWLASPSTTSLKVPLEALVGRWQKRDLEAQLITPAHIRLRLDQRYLDWFWSSLRGGEGLARGESLSGEEGGRAAGPATAAGAAINRDLHPVGLFYGLAYWNALFAPSLSRALATVGTVNAWLLVLFLAAAGLLVLAFIRLTGRGQGAVVPVAIAATGFAGMTADLVIIFAFQSLYGYVYHWIGLLITAFIAGLALGGWWMTRRLVAPPQSPSRAVEIMGGQRRALLFLEGALILYWMLVPLVLAALYAHLGHPLVAASVQVMLFLLNGLAGLLVGAQFPLANQIWLRDGVSREGRAGVLYAADLVGAFLASVLVSVLLIPVLGIVQTCLLVAVLKVMSLMLVAILVRNT